VQYLDIEQISNYFAICEIIAHDPFFTNLGDLLQILAISDKPRAVHDPDLKPAVFTLINTLMTQLDFLVFAGSEDAGKPLKTLHEVTSYLDSNWNTAANRSNLLIFKRR
jgi:hypothetical protein